MTPNSSSASFNRARKLSEAETSSVVVAIACLVALAFVTPLGRVYLVGVAAVAAMLVYEQSLVRAHDLSQVKRAFDLNGYVGILYLLVLVVSLYGRW